MEDLPQPPSPQIVIVILCASSIVFVKLRMRGEASSGYGLRGVVVI